MTQTHPTKTEEELFEEEVGNYLRSLNYGSNKFKGDGEKLADDIKSFLHESNRRYARQVVEKLKETIEEIPTGDEEVEMKKDILSAIREFKENLEKELNK